MLCNFNLIGKYLNPQIAKTSNFLASARQQVAALKPLATDAFEKTVRSKEEIKAILNGDYRKLTKEFLDSIDPKEIKDFIDLKSFSESSFAKDIVEVSKYTDLLLRGIKKMDRGKKIKIIGIGRSPAIFLQDMKLKGMDTTIIPISGLREMTCLDYNALKNGKWENYFKYLKDKCNFDIYKMDKDTDYIFTDYAFHGSSLKRFSEILQAKGFTGENVKVMSMRNIINAGGLSPEEMQFSFSLANKLQSCYLKTLYSPIPQLDIIYIPTIYFDNLKLYEKAQILSNKFFCALYDYDILGNKSAYPVLNQ